MGYQSDLAKNKSLQNDVNRHNDNYSSLDLKQDLVLVTALISHFLQTTDFSDREMFSINRKELCEMIELKRKLFETNIKLDDLRFRQELDLRKLNKFSHEDFTASIEKFMTLIEQEIPQEFLDKLLSKLPSILAELPSG